MAKDMIPNNDSKPTETPATTTPLTNPLPHIGVDVIGIIPSKLTNVEVLALAKVIGDTETKTTNELVQSGTFNVDFSVRIRGGLKKGEAYEQHAVQSIPWLAVAYHLAQEVSADALTRSIDRAMGEDDGKVKNWKAENEAKLTALKGKTLKNFQGKVTTALTFERV